MEKWNERYIIATTIVQTYIQLFIFNTVSLYRYSMYDILLAVAIRRFQTDLDTTEAEIRTGGPIEFLNDDGGTRHNMYSHRSIIKMNGTVALHHAHKKGCTFS
jgi:hypothetical protein